jgi:uncharacterized protein YyaL (SSP411 family)
LRPFHEVLRATYLPNAVQALADPADAGRASRVPLLEGKTDVGGRPAAYVCEDGACKLPVTSAHEMRGLLETPRS